MDLDLEVLQELPVEEEQAVGCGHSCAATCTNTCLTTFAVSAG
jgi:hypothetical protein